MTIPYYTAKLKVQKSTSSGPAKLAELREPSVSQDVFYSLQKAEETSTPLKINGWNIIPWRFGSDHVPF